LSDTWFPPTLDRARMHDGQLGKSGVKSHYRQLATVPSRFRGR
jgi:hypothetical protein